MFAIIKPSPSIEFSDAGGSFSTAPLIHDSISEVLLMSKAGPISRVKDSMVANIGWRIVSGANYAHLDRDTLKDSGQMFIKLLFFRIILLTFSISFFLSAVDYVLSSTLGLNFNSNANNAIFHTIMTIVAVLVEEQARWLFAARHNSALRSQVFFLPAIIIVEFFLTVMDGRYTIGSFLYWRTPSMVMHFVASTMCVLYFSTKSKWRVALLAFAIAIHLTLDLISNHMGRSAYTYLGFSGP